MTATPSLAEAENLVAVTLLRLPQWADAESLVYDTTGGGRRLVAAMHRLETGTPLEEAPPFGGGLVQWHTHEDLCCSPEGYVQGITDAAGDCADGA